MSKDRQGRESIFADGSANMHLATHLPALIAVELAVEFSAQLAAEEAARHRCRLGGGGVALAVQRHGYRAHLLRTKLYAVPRICLGPKDTSTWFAWETTTEASS